MLLVPHRGAHPTCTSCGEKAKLRNALHVYGREMGAGRRAKMFWRCDSCDAHVGCHPGTHIPLGPLANAEIRAWRRAAHEAFDPLWKQDGMTRGAAYAVLAEWMGLPQAKTHIGHFDVTRCMEVVAVMAAIRPANREAMG